MLSRSLVGSSRVNDLIQLCFAGSPALSFLVLADPELIADTHHLIMNLVRSSRSDYEFERKILSWLYSPNGEQICFTGRVRSACSTTSKLVNDQLVRYTCLFLMSPF